MTTQFVLALSNVDNIYLQIKTTVSVRVNTRCTSLQMAWVGVIDFSKEKKTFFYFDFCNISKKGRKIINAYLKTNETAQHDI